MSSTMSTTDTTMSTTDTTMAAAATPLAAAAAAAASAALSPPPTTTPSSRPRLVAVIGPTGSGKSKLGVQLARWVADGGLAAGAAADGAASGAPRAVHAADVINCDVMQMYAGLDIASAKPSADERAGVAHHMLSFLQPRQPFTVRDFRAMAGELVVADADAHKLPFVVGGTMYYVQSLLRDTLLDEGEGGGAFCGGGGGGGGSGGSSGGGSSGGGGGTSITEVAGVKRRTAGSGEEEAAYERLAAVDPVMATRLHPNDSRRIARALEVFDTTGVPYSEVVRRQHEGGGGSAAPAPFDVLVLWLTVSDKAVHNARLDARVQTMLASGLLDELRALRAYLAAPPGTMIAPTEPPTAATVAAWATRVAAPRGAVTAIAAAAGSGDDEAGIDGDSSGVLQAIGYKEFVPYLAAAAAAVASGAATAADIDARERAVIAAHFAPMGDARRDVVGGGDALAGALHAAITKLMDATHHYARVQHRFINNRFVRRGIQLHALDTSDVAAWDVAVVRPAQRLVADWLAGAPLGANEVAATATTATTAASKGATTDAATLFGWRKFHCDACDADVNGEHEWAAHNRSTRHARAVAFRRRAATLLAERGIVLQTKPRRRSSGGGAPPPDSGAPAPAE